MRLLLAQFVSFTIFPAQAKLALSNGSASNEQLEWQVTMRHALIKGLLHEVKATNHLRSLLNVNMDYETSIYLGLCEMAILSPINERLESDVEYLLRFLADDGVEMVFRTFTHDSIRCLWSDEALSLHSYAEYRKLFFERLNGKVMEIRENGKLHVVDLGKKSMKVTSKVVAVQSSRRKEFMRKTRTAILELFEAELVLKDIVSQLCHPEAPCSNSHCWPVGWALDPTEGPMRERKKLMPSYYAIDSSFFQRERQQMVKSNREVHPLVNIISNPYSGRHALQCTVIDEHIFTNLDVKLLRGPMECDGELLVGKGAIYFLEKFNELDFSDLNVELSFENLTT
uniref:Secreted protein n=1 Tax=Angiostrongylus cantonensis TaxID=6313 RepID=A0A0K0D213_ANGCA